MRCTQQGLLDQRLDLHGLAVIADVSGATAICVTKCTSNASCPVSGDTCDLPTGICSASTNTCSMPNTQATCNYGEVCVDTGTDNQCFVPNDCPAVTSPPAITVGHSPVIFSVIRTGATRQDPIGCADASGNPLTIVEFQGHFYDPDGDVTNTGTYSHIKAVKPSGSLQSTYEHTSVDLTGGTFKFELCSPNQSVMAGVVLIDQANHDSNVVCLP